MNKQIISVFLLSSLWITTPAALAASSSSAVAAVVSPTDDSEDQINLGSKTWYVVSGINEPPITGQIYRSMSSKDSSDGFNPILSKAYVPSNANGIQTPKDFLNHLLGKQQENPQTKVNVTYIVDTPDLITVVIDEKYGRTRFGSIAKGKTGLFMMSYGVGEISADAKKKWLDIMQNQVEMIAQNSAENTPDIWIPGTSAAMLQQINIDNQAWEAMGTTYFDPGIAEVYIRESMLRNMRSGQKITEMIIKGYAPLNTAGMQTPKDLINLYAKEASASNKTTANDPAPVINYISDEPNQAIAEITRSNTKTLIVAAKTTSGIYIMSYNNAELTTDNINKWKKILVDEVTRITNNTSANAVDKWIPDATTALKPQPAQPTDLKNVTIMLKRTACYGSCPVYTVTIKGDGTVTYNGEAYVKTTGTQTYQIPAAKVKELVADFYKTHFFNLKNNYVSGMTDMPWTTTTISFGNTYKSIHHDYAGPGSLFQLEQMIDETANTISLIGKNRE